MLGFLFWNTGKKNDVSSHLIQLVSDLRPQIVILAESSLDIKKLGIQLTRATGSIYHEPENYGGNKPRLKFLSALPRGSVTPLRDYQKMALKTIKDPFAGDMLLSAVHLQSKLHCTETEQLILAIRTAESLHDFSLKNPTIPMMVAGDFNMNPFEPGMISSDGFFALMDKDLVKKSQDGKKIQGRDTKPLYNPLWNTLGDLTSGPKGSFFYQKSTPVNYFWNIFDQVLFSHHLVESIEDVILIDQLSTGSLADANGMPCKKSASDHFPLYFKINTKNLKK